MIMWWFLFLILFSLSEQDGHQTQTGVSQCGPQNLTVRGLDQTLLVEWEDDVSCLTLNDPILYKMTVLIENKEVHSDEVSVTPGGIGLTHSWNWTSHVPLKCASHTFRLKSQINNQTSLLEQEQTLAGGTGSDLENVFPQDAVLEVGSMATFCCIVPDGEQFDKLYLSGSTDRNISTKMISEQRYTLTVELEEVWDRCVDVLCETKEPTKRQYGACVYIGYPPDVSDLQCETRDLESVECLWKEGRDTMVKVMSPTIYRLDGSICDSKSNRRCYKKVRVEGGEKTWTLTAWNKLGKVEIQDAADLTKRVHMLAPHELTVADVNARNASLNWRWSVQQYRNLNLTCQINITHTHGYSQHGVGLNATVVTDLRPNCKYKVKVRCRTAQHIWKWGDWSQSVTFHTEGDVPDSLDVWMKKEENQTVIVWKMPPENQSHGDITEYEVTWAKTGHVNQLNKTRVHPSVHRNTLCLDTSGEHVVTVTARNKHGSSSPSTITVPVITAKETSMNTSRITGSNGGFNLSWSGSPEASCGYIVDWVPAVWDGPVDWLKLPPSQTSIRITSGNLTDGLRYSLSIYACTQTSPVLLEKKEGYTSETRIKEKLFSPLRFKQKGSDVEISWDPVPLKQQSAFIRGYVLYCRDESGQSFSVTSDNPEDTSLTAKNLKISSYTFTVVAQTAVGECGNTSVTATLNFQTDSFIKIFFISLGVVFILLFLITVLCYKHWACIKQKVYPQMPKPDMADWFTSPARQKVKNIHPHLIKDPSHHTEEHMDIPQLLYKSEEPLNNNTQQEYMALISSQTPQGYQNLTLDTSEPSMSVFPNLTYNLLMPAEDRTPSLEPRLQVKNGYRPQSLAEIFHQDQTDRNPIFCVSEYIMGPQPSL